eukprot:scaffold30904_cov88-Phaeocystis_antarctica.AAC.8
MSLRRVIPARTATEPKPSVRRQGNSARTGKAHCTRALPAASACACASALSPRCPQTVPLSKVTALSHPPAVGQLPPRLVLVAVAARRHATTRSLARVQKLDLGRAKNTSRAQQRRLVRRCPHGEQVCVVVEARPQAPRQ